MKKNRFLLLAGILGFAFMGASCSRASSGGGDMVRRAIEVQVEDVAHCEDDLVIAEPRFAEEAPTSEKKQNAQPTRQWEDKDTGFVVFGVLMGVSACLIATMVTLSLLKKKKGAEPKEETK